MEIGGGGEGVGREVGGVVEGEEVVGGGEGVEGVSSWWIGLWGCLELLEAIFAIWLPWGKNEVLLMKARELRIGA